MFYNKYGGRWIKVSRTHGKALLVEYFKFVVFFAGIYGYNKLELYIFMDYDDLISVFF